jgi:hypothetical protein
VIRHHFNWQRASMAAGLCYGSRGGGAQLAFHHQVGAYDTDTLIGALEGLRRFLGGQKATLVWDGLPAHRSKLMQAWLRRQRSWLVTEPLPGYAPDLNPVEMSLPQYEFCRASLACVSGSLSWELSIGVPASVQRRRLW